METLPGEIMGWNGMTMVTKLGLRTSEINQLPYLSPGCSQCQVPSDTYSFFSQLPLFSPQDSQK